jgi:hypothetical protein
MLRIELIGARERMRAQIQIVRNVELRVESSDSDFKEVSRVEHNIDSSSELSRRDSTSSTDTSNGSGEKVSFGSYRSG